MGKKPLRCSDQAAILITFAIVDASAIRLAGEANVGTVYDMRVNGAYSKREEAWLS
jgi:hypothetical protein